MYLYDGDGECHSPECAVKADSLLEAARLVVRLRDAVRALDPTGPAVSSIRPLFIDTERLLEDLAAQGIRP